MQFGVNRYEAHLMEGPSAKSGGRPGVGSLAQASSGPWPCRTGIDALRLGNLFVTERALDLGSRAAKIQRRGRV